jgi:hypothetical protein
VSSYAVAGKSRRRFAVPQQNSRVRDQSLARVSVTPDLAAEWDAHYGVVVTEPRYSRTGYQQTVVPVLDEACEERSLDVAITEGEWFARLGEGYRTAILAAAMVSTLYLPEHITHFLDAIVPPETMARLDTALIAHFRL